MSIEGFWAVGGYTISFRKDGAWYADEERIRNPRIQLLFSQSIRAGECRGGETGPSGEAGPADAAARAGGDDADAAGERWVLDLGVDCQRVVVEDTPLVVTGIDGDPEHGFEIRTNDGESGPLDVDTLEVGQGDVLYCRVDRGDRGVMPARFLRPAYYRITHFVETDGDHHVLRDRGRTVRID